MKTTKYLTSMLMLIGLMALNSFADLATYPLSNTSTPIVILTNISGRINTISMVNPSAAAITLKFYDGIYTSLTRTNAAYTNSVSSVATVTTIYTNILGRLETNAISTLVTTPTPVNAAVITLSPIIQATIPAGSTYSYTPVSTLSFGQGLVVGTSATNVSAIVDYTGSR